MTDQETLETLRGHFQRVYDAIISCQQRVSKWFEEAKTIEPETDEICELVKEILLYELEYQRSINAGDLPPVEKFTDEELEKRIGSVERLSKIGEEMIRLGTAIEMRVLKLRYLLAGNQIQ